MSEMIKALLSAVVDALLRFWSSWLDAADLTEHALAHPGHKPDRHAL